MARTSTNLTGTPWKKGGPAYNLARALLTSGAVGLNESACELQGLYKQFRDLNLKSFTSGLDRLKEELKMKPGDRFSSSLADFIAENLLQQLCTGVYLWDSIGGPSRPLQTPVGPKWPYWTAVDPYYPEIAISGRSVAVGYFPWCYLNFSCSAH